MKTRLNVLIVLIVLNIVITGIVGFKTLITTKEFDDKPPVEESEIERLKASRDTIVIIIDSLKHEQNIEIENAKTATDSSALDMWYKLLHS